MLEFRSLDKNSANDRASVKVSSFHALIVGEVGGGQLTIVAS